jgi:hypothetical protein
MVNKPRSESERLGRILDRLAEYIEDAPGEQLLEDAHLEGRDPAQTAKRVRALLAHAVNKHHAAHLKKAQDSYQEAVAAMKSRFVKLPQTPEGRRNLLGAILAQQPALRPAFTFQNRDFTELTDEDVENHLRKLALLGVLDDEETNRRT